MCPLSHKGDSSSAPRNRRRESRSPGPAPYISRKQAYDIIGLDRWYFGELIRGRTLPPKFIGGRPRFSVQDVIEVMKEFETAMPDYRQQSREITE
jgi:hypothetical protein